MEYTLLIFIAIVVYFIKNKNCFNSKLKLFLTFPLNTEDVENTWKGKTTATTAMLISDSNNDEYELN